MRFEMMITITDMEHPDQTGLSGDIASALEDLTSLIRRSGEDWFLPFFTESLSHDEGIISTYYGGTLVWSIKPSIEF